MADLDLVRRLRRFAAAMTGSIAAGDACVEVALSRIADRAEGLDDGAYADVIRVASDAASPPPTAAAGCGRRERVAAALRAMDPPQRAALLLHALEGLNLEATARILQCPVSIARGLLDAAEQELIRMHQAKVLIIEDDLLTAHQVGRIAARMGCSIVGFARRDADALAIADTTHPHLVIADVNLHLGGICAWAAERIAEMYGAKVVFETAYPDLICSKRQRAFPLVNKPIHVPRLQSAILSAVAA